MRLWVILLLLVISTVLSKKARNDKPLPPINDGEEPTDEYEDDSTTEEKPQKTKNTGNKVIDKKNTADDGSEDDDAPAKPAKGSKKEKTSLETKAGKKPNGGKTNKKKQEADPEPEPFNYENDDDTEHDWSVCDASSNEPCTCEGTELKCEKIVFKDRLPLDTADLVISKTSFVALKASFKDNAIISLKKGKILPGHEHQMNEVDFSHNMIMHIEPGTISMLTNCSKIRLSNNRLTTVRKSWFESSKTVHQLYLDDNKITSIDDGAFGGLNLTKLVLDGNKIKLNNHTFDGLDYLESLSMDNCNLDDDMATDIFDNLPRLTELSLRGNIFTAVPLAIQVLKNLKDLDLSETNIAELHELSFNDDHDMEEIWMENMPYLYSIQGCSFCGLQKLKELHMNNNTKLDHIDPDAFGNDEGKVDRKVTSLKIFHVENSKLTNISQSLLNWNAITELAIGNSPINCSCSNAYLLGGKTFKFDNRNIVPVCKSPPALKGRPLAKVQPYEACNTIKAVETTSRAVAFLSVVMVGCFFCLGAYVFYSSGRMNACIGRVRDARNNFPAMSYANLSNTDEGRSLEQDFQPRPEEV